MMARPSVRALTEWGTLLGTIATKPARAQPDCSHDAGGYDKNAILTLFVHAGERSRCAETVSSSFRLYRSPTEVGRYSLGSSSRTEYG